MNCPNCGEKNQKSAVFCTNCGTRLQGPVGKRKSEQGISDPKQRSRIGRFFLILAAALVGGFVLLVIVRMVSRPTVTEVLSTPTTSTGIIIGGEQAGATSDAGVSTDGLAETLTPEANQLVGPTPQGGGIHGQIAFSSDRAGIPQIWLINLDGSNEQQLTDIDTGACQAEWSPDGLKIAFTSPCPRNQTSYPDSAIYIVDLSTNEIRQVTSGGAGDYDPAWSPDGSTIAFTTLRVNNRPQIYFYDLVSAEESFFSLGPAYLYQQEWSPTGDQLIYVTTAIGPELLFRSLMEERELLQFLREDVADGKAISSPEWSRDAELIYYTVTPQSGGFSQLYWSSVADNGLTKHLIFDEGIPARDSSLSPDGLWLVFESWPNTGNHDIWLATADGAELQPLTKDAGNDFDPAWRP